MSVEVIVYARTEESLQLISLQKYWTHIQDLDTVTIVCNPCKPEDEIDVEAEFFCRHDGCDKYSCIIIELPHSHDVPEPDSYTFYGGCKYHTCCANKQCDYRVGQKEESDSDSSSEYSWCSGS